ncbi:PadR family transcriptional regulator [Lacticaseibacillus daqingensis]|uniref:PadR family transcriptional regulator n=1 Tax=Lacticaseibacillus daqingensis TaxID=2486014 RepID=UPI000F78D3A1|nr:PadR family transcriptional regulator [Lacticaseibacillus daqingensis]
MSQLPTQLLKGTLEGAILALIEEQETYAYALHETLERRGFGPVADGTIYPLLLKLERAGQIQGIKYASPSGGPPRKYYHILPAGTATLATFRQDWQQLAQAMTRVMGATEDDG